jgi:DNA-binding MarR family transcriptional regulator
MMYLHIIMGKRPQSPHGRPKTLRSDARSALESCAGWNLRQAARRVGQFLEDRMAGSGVSVAQFGLMAEIASADDDTVGALSARMGLDQSTLSRTLRTLEADGLVEIAVVESDQRKRMVWLTEKGARRLESALASWRQAHAQLSRQLSVDLVRRLAREANDL